MYRFPLRNVCCNYKQLHFPINIDSCKCHTLREHNTRKKPKSQHADDQTANTTEFLQHKHFKKSSRSLFMFDRVLPFFFPPYAFAGVMIQESNKNGRSCKLFISSFSEWELGNALLNSAKDGKRIELSILCKKFFVHQSLTLNSSAHRSNLSFYGSENGICLFPTSSFLFYATCGRNNLELDPPTLLNSAWLWTQRTLGCLFSEILLKAMGSQLEFGWSTAQFEHIAK